MIGSTLGATPEWLASAGHRILGQAEEQLPNSAVVLLFELKTSPNNALFECQRLVRDKELHKLFNLLPLLARIFEIVLEVVGFREVRVASLGRLDEEIIELGSRPLHTRCQIICGLVMIILTSMVCWMALGKFFTVHDGVSFSGGS